MTAEQKTWFVEHPAFERWSPPAVVSIRGWTDVGYLQPNGTFVAEGKSHAWAWPMRLMSSGDTLHVLSKDAVKVGRQYFIA